jgi:hypothetical protein
MNFLKKIGMAVANVAGIVSGYGPVLAALTPTPKDDKAVAVIEDSLSQIRRVIVDVEAMGAVLAIKGPDKARAAAPAIAQIVLRSLALAGLAMDEAKAKEFAAASEKLGGAVADLLNCCKASK